MTICLNPCKIREEFMQLHMENIKVTLKKLKPLHTFDESIRFQIKRHHS